MKFEMWGEIPYQQATDKQLELVQRRINGEIEDTWVFCSHPPIVTMGRASIPEDIQGWSGELSTTSRGGRATFHGPNQIVIYPIVKLLKRDILHFLNSLERIAVNAIKPFGLNVQMSRQSQTPKPEEALIPTGVWVEQKKIASIGIAVKKWVTYHGMAINIEQDDMAFTGISPCGYKANVMTSLEQELGYKISRDQVLIELQKAITAFYQ